MHRITRTVVAIVLVSTVLQTSVIAAEDRDPGPRADVQTVAAPSATANEAVSPYIPVAPCRILDTRSQPPKNGTEEAARDIDVQATRCRKVVPLDATVYSLQVTTYARDAASAAPLVSARKVPVPAGRLLHFPVPPDSHVAVDIDGYHVAPGTPVGPPAAPVGGGPANDRDFARGAAPGTDDDLGTTGQIFTNGTGLTDVGILLVGNTTTPWTVVKAGSTSYASGFYVANNANAPLLAARNDGAVQLYNGAFFDGQSDFFGSYGSLTNVNVAIKDNVVHNVQLVNPRDAASGTNTPIVFFNAKTDDDRWSPVMTKYRAYTLGGYSAGLQRINYDSIFHEHLGSEHYHYRAWSGAENKPTFWLKALSPDPNGTTQTRADMYVSGRVGIGAGTTSPAHALDVAGHNATTGTTVDISSDIDTGSKWANQVNITNARGAYGLVLGYNGAGLSPLAYHQPRGAHVVNVHDGPLTLGTANAGRITITAAGAVGIGTPAPGAGRLFEVNGNAHFSGTVTGNNIQAMYQDVAEWVPAAQDLTPGTVVVLDSRSPNTVTASSTGYDTTVAGVVSAQAGLILGEGGAKREMIATTGRVRVRVDASERPIAIGDLLVTSDKPGVAMRSTPVELAGVTLHRPGTIIGKALEPLAGGEGEILVLLSLQ